MNGRLRTTVLGLTAAAFFGLPAVSSVGLQAQEASARFRVFVPDLKPQDDSRKNFGEDVAEELRDLINDLATHQPVGDREVRDALRRYDVDRDELDCNKSRQLAGLIEAKVVMCGVYVEEADERYTVSAFFVDVQTNEELHVDPITVGKEDEDKRAAARHIFQFFDRMVQQIRYGQFCGEYAASQQWENSLQNCDQAIELNPESVGSHYTRAVVLRELDRLEEALAAFQTVLELDPLHEDAMQNAGYVSALLGRPEDARQYYQSYLELNPANASVRMNVAYELAQAGDPLGAMQIIQVGLDVDPDNVDLWQQYGGFAFTAGANAMAGMQGTEGGDAAVPDEVASLYREAIGAFGRVYAAKGAEMLVGQLRNLVAAHLRLGEADQAATLGQRFLETHGGEATLWSIYADALQRNDQVEEAIAALDEVMRIDPEYPSVFARQGKWLLDADRVDDALPVLREAVTRGEQSADAIAQMIFADAYTKGIQPDTKRWNYAIRMITAAKQFEVGEQMQEQLDFWHGWSLFQRAIPAQEPNTLETARATLPEFQQALRFFQSSRGYAGRQGINLQQLLDAASTYVEIQEAIIQRGGR